MRKALQASSGATVPIVFNSDYLIENSGGSTLECCTPEVHLIKGPRAIEDRKLLNNVRDMNV